MGLEAWVAGLAGQRDLKEALRAIYTRKRQVTNSAWEEAPWRLEPDYDRGVLDDRGIVCVGAFNAHWLVENFGQYDWAREFHPFMQPGASSPIGLHFPTQVNEYAIARMYRAENVRVLRPGDERWPEPQKQPVLEIVLAPDARVAEVRWWDQ